MTEEEQDRIVGGMVRELRELRSAETCLVTKLQSMMMALELSAGLAEEMVMNKTINTPWRVVDGKLLIGQDECEYPNPNDFGACLKELKDSRDRITELTERIKV